MAKKKKEVDKLSESQIKKLYVIVNGFNDGRQGDKRFDAGGFVTKENFHADTWKVLLEAGDIAVAEPVVPLAENETIVFEEIE